MAPRSIGLLHPGEMGAGIGAVLVASGHRVGWASAGRSAASARRASAAGLVDARTIHSLVESCDLILSVCPPSAALELANVVSGFPGLYVDANAIAPQTAREVAAVIEDGGGSYVDGGVIGPPPGGRATTRLYLSGSRAKEVGGLFGDTEVAAVVISEDPVAASAMKMCFAAWTKGTTALVLAVRALARAEGVEEHLLTEWDHTDPDLVSRSERAAGQAATKGWRWVGEMEEIAATFRAAGLPDGFHQAAAEVYARSPRIEEAGADAATLGSVLASLDRRTVA